MERKQFLRNGFLSALSLAAIAPAIKSCSKSNGSMSASSDSDSTSTTTGSGTCTDTPVEEEGPFPTHTPSSLVTTDITSDRKGVALSINITINNSNNSCAAYPNAIVDIWECDAAGNYSEYGGNTQQSTNYTSVHFLRGRQVSSSSGVVTYKAIYPGWYTGRAPHIHVHVYSSDGTSLLITQIAFPTDVSDTVYTTDTTNYTKGEQGTSNSEDHVFSDTLAYDLATVTGSVADGYVLTHLITVAA